MTLAMLVVNVERRADGAGADRFQTRLFGPLEPLRLADRLSEALS